MDNEARISGAFANLRNAIINYVMSACLSVRKEQFGSHWMNFNEILYFKIFRKYVQKIHVSIKYDKNDGHLTWVPVYISDNISLNSS